MGGSGERGGIEGCRVLLEGVLDWRRARAEVRYDSGRAGSMSARGG